MAQNNMLNDLAGFIKVFYREIIIALAIAVIAIVIKVMNIGSAPKDK